MFKAFTISVVLSCLLLAAAPAWAKNSSQVNRVSALAAWDMLQEQPKSTFLVDVRSRCEYTLLGHPPQAYNIPWRQMTTKFQVAGQPYEGGKAEYTGYQLEAEPNPDFLEVVKSLFKPDDRIILLSRDGAFGTQAAKVLAKGGFKHIYYVDHGYLGEPQASKEEGELAEKYSPHQGQPGRVNGWLFWGLPVSHKVDPRYVYPPDIKRMQTIK